MYSTSNFWFKSSDFHSNETTLTLLYKILFAIRADSENGILNFFAKENFVSDNNKEIAVFADLLKEIH